jgi:hypothetical protein
VDLTKKQVVCIKCWVNIGKGVTETLMMISQVFGDESMSPPRPKKGETGEEQSQEYAYHFL